MGFIPSRNHFLQMAVLSLYHLISGFSMVREITWATQLLAGHCLHQSRFLSRIGHKSTTCATSALHSPPQPARPLESSSTLHHAMSLRTVARGVLLRS